MTRRVQETLAYRAADDAVQAVLGGGARDPVDRRVHVAVLERGRLVVESRAELEQRDDAAAAADAAAGRRDDPGDDLEQRALAGAVRADDAEDRAALDVERHIAQGPQLARVEDLARQRKRQHPPDPIELRFGTRRRRLCARDPVPLADSLDAEAVHLCWTECAERSFALSVTCVYVRLPHHQGRATRRAAGNPQHTRALSTDAAPSWLGSVTHQTGIRLGAELSAGAQSRGVRGQILN